MGGTPRYQKYGPGVFQPVMTVGTECTWRWACLQKAKTNPLCWHLLEAVAWRVRKQAQGETAPEDSRSHGIAAGSHGALRCARSCPGLWRRDVLQHRRLGCFQPHPHSCTLSPGGLGLSPSLRTGLGFESAALPRAGAGPTAGCRGCLPSPCPMSQMLWQSSLIREAVYFLNWAITRVGLN